MKNMTIAQLRATARKMSEERINPSPAPVNAEPSAEPKAEAATLMTKEEFVEAMNSDEPVVLKPAVAIAEKPKAPRKEERIKRFLRWVKKPQEVVAEENVPEIIHEIVQDIDKTLEAADKALTADSSVINTEPPVVREPQVEHNYPKFDTSRPLKMIDLSGVCPDFNAPKKPVKYSFGSIIKKKAVTSSPDEAMYPEA